MNCLRRQTYWRSKSLLGRNPRWRAAGEEEPRRTRTALPYGTVSGFTIMGLAFQVVSGQSSCLALVVHASQKRWVLASGFLGGWQDILGAGVSSSFWPLLNSLFSTAALWFLIGISRCEAARASSYYCTWPRPVFLDVNCSLTSWILITNGLLSNRGENISIWNDTCDKGTWDRI